MKDIPIVLFHLSDQHYVSYSLRAASRYNTRVMIITDVNPANYSAYAEVIPFQTLPDSQARRFAKGYTHLSTNRYAFEFHAIEKYFYLLELMKARQLERIVYIDSDVMVFSDLTPVMAACCQGADLAFAMQDQQYEDLDWSASGHISYWTYTALEAFCIFILETYEDHRDILEPKWSWHQQHHMPGGINDMTLIYLFQRQSSLKSLSFLQVFENEYTFDNAIRWGTNEYKNEYRQRYCFLMGSEIKDIRFDHGLPYGYNVMLDKSVRFCILHFQGSAKKLMPYFLPYPREWKDWIFLCRWTLRIIYARFRQLAFNEE